MCQAKTDVEIAQFLGDVPPLIFQLRGTRPSRPPPAFDAHVYQQEPCGGCCYCC